MNDELEKAIYEMAEEVSDIRSTMSEDSEAIKNRLTRIEDAIARLKDDIIGFLQNT